MHPHLCKGLKRSASSQRGAGSGRWLASLLRLRLKFDKALHRNGVLTPDGNLASDHLLPKEGRKGQALGLSFKFNFTT